VRGLEGARKLAPGALQDILVAFQQPGSKRAYDVYSMLDQDLMGLGISLAMMALVTALALAGRL
jgi:hypothetical protein